MKLSSKADEEDGCRNDHDFWNSGQPDVMCDRALRTEFVQHFDLVRKCEEAALKCMLFQFSLIDTHTHS